MFHSSDTMQSEHKIQSGKGSLHIEMDQVPKILKPMVDDWTGKDGYIVSFKACRCISVLIPALILVQLETDQALLIPKAQTSLQRYGHQIVIGNDLNRRKFEVVFISWKTRSNKEVSDREETSSFSESWVRIDPHDQTKEIEEDIIAELVTRHDVWIKGG